MVQLQPHLCRTNKRDRKGDRLHCNLHRYAERECLGGSGRVRWSQRQMRDEPATRRERGPRSACGNTMTLRRCVQKSTGDSMRRRHRNRASRAQTILILGGWCCLAVTLATSGRKLSWNGVVGEIRLMGIEASSDTWIFASFQWPKKDPKGNPYYAAIAGTREDWNSNGILSTPIEECYYYGPLNWACVGCAVYFGPGVFEPWIKSKVVVCPAWTPPLLFWIYPGVVLLCASIRRRVRRTQGRCSECGYDLRGSGSGQCPECGCAVESLEKGECL